MSVIRDPITHVGQRVTVNGQSETHSTSITEIQWFSRHKRTAYLANGQSDTLTAAKVPVLYLKNTSADQDLIVFGMDFQTIAEAATIPAVGIYWSIDLNAVVSGGTALTPVNLNTGASKAAQATVLHSTPTIDTAGTEVARFYARLDGLSVAPDSGQAFVVAPNGSCLLSYTTTGSAGIANANILFYMRDVVE